MSFANEFIFVITFVYTEKQRTQVGKMQEGHAPVPQEHDFDGI